MDRRNFEFMFYGFTVAWLIVFGYLLTLVRRGSRIRREWERHEAMQHERPTMREWLENTRHAKPVEETSSAAQIMHESRDAR